MKVKKDERETKVVKMYVSDFEYITKHFYEPFQTTVADAIELALNLSRSSGRKGKSNAVTPKEKDVRGQ